MSYHKLGFVKTEQIALTTKFPFDKPVPDTVWKDGSAHPAKQNRTANVVNLVDQDLLTVYTHGSISETPSWFNEGQDDAQLSFKFKPDHSDMKSLGDFDKALTVFSDHRDRLLEHLKVPVNEDGEYVFAWTHRSIFDDNCRLKIKMKPATKWVNKKKVKTRDFEFDSNEMINFDNFNDFFRKGTPVTLISKLSYYFMDDGKYGLYLTVTDVDFDKEEVEKPAPKKKVKKS